MKTAPFLLPVCTLAIALLFQPALQAQFYDERDLSSRNLVLPEMEQFRLGARLFLEKDKKLAAWKSFQTFLFNYPDSPIAADAQFMLAESIFAQSISEMRSGNPPDEIAWRRNKKGKAIGKGGKELFHFLRKAASKISGEAAPTKEPDRIDIAAFSEAIIQYKKVLARHTL